MIQGTKKIDEFVKQATSLHAINIGTFVACVVFFIYLIWLSGTQAYPMMLPLYYSGAVLASSFALKLAMQSSKVLRAEVTDAEYDVLVLVLNLVSLYLMLETMTSFSGVQQVVDFILCFLPGFLMTLFLPLFIKDVEGNARTGGATGFFHFLKWSLGISLATMAFMLFRDLIVSQYYLPISSNAVVALSPFLVKYLSTRFKSQLRAKFIDEMYRDPLTGIANRKCYYDHYDAWRQSITRSTAQGVFVIFADIDFFKQYNDHYGHEEGDHCLHDVAQDILTLSQRLSENYGVRFNAYRYGGEEFILAGMMSHDDAVGLMEAPELVDWIRGQWTLPRTHFATPSGQVTLSAGADWIDSDMVYRTNAAGATKRADELLYDVKKNGRARLKVSPELYQNENAAV